MSQITDSILDAVAGGLIVVDSGRRVVHWNAWMKRASGLSIAQVHGRPILDVFPGVGLTRLGGAIDSALDSGMSGLLTHALHPRIFPLKTAAGRELLHDVSVSPIGLGLETMCLVHIADVTAAVRRERYLRERQNARYNAVVESAPDAILTMDGDGIIRHANPAALKQFGYPENELIGQSVKLLFKNENIWNDAWSTILKGEELRHPIELIVQRKDSALSYFEVSVSRWRDYSHVFVTAILRNIDERRAAHEALRASEEQARAAAAAVAELNATLEQRVRERTDKLLEVEEALRQSQKMDALGQLTGGIAHDFNNLLQGIIGALNMMQKRVAEGRISEVDRFLKGALSSADRASTLTQRLLAFSRRQPIDPRPININQLIGEMEELLRRSIGEKIRMEIVAADDLWLVRCDANQLENALLNLAINARDAMPDGGTLSITTSNRIFDSRQALVRDIKPGNYVCLAISDTGVGMPPEVQLRAFEPFYTTKPIGHGTGLGLSMIYGFVRQSDGSVRIESREGKGTTVELCMPRFEGSLEPGIGVAENLTDERMGRNEIVLVVEDEDVVRLLVVEVLKDLGYHALEATDGSAALRILQSSQRVDLLVTDIGLPDLNGRQVADAARMKRHNLKILFMTGYAESAAGSEFLEEGMQIISKPFTMDKIATKIRDIIESRM